MVGSDQEGEIRASDSLDAGLGKAGKASPIATTSLPVSCPSVCYKTHAVDSRVPHRVLETDEVLRSTRWTDQSTGTVGLQRCPHNTQEVHLELLRGLRSVPGGPGSRRFPIRCELGLRDTKLRPLWTYPHCGLFHCTTALSACLFPRVQAAILHLFDHR